MRKNEQTKEYYKSVANRIEELKDVKIDKGGYDNYYINKVKETVKVAIARCKGKSAFNA